MSTYIGDETVFSKEIKAFADQVQELENALWDMYDKRNVQYVPQAASTTRNMLDDFGDNVGQPRMGMTDANYSIAINAKIAANKSRGTPEDIITALRQMLLAWGNSSPDIHYSEFYPGCIYITFAGTTAPEGLASYMQRCATGGVRVCVVMVDPTAPFTFDGDSGYDVGALGTLLT